VLNGVLNVRDFVMFGSLIKIGTDGYFRLYGGDYSIGICWFIGVGFVGVFVGKHLTLF